MPPFSKTIRSSASIFHLNIEKKFFGAITQIFVLLCTRYMVNCFIENKNLNLKKTYFSLPTLRLKIFLLFSSWQLSFENVNGWWAVYHPNIKKKLSLSKHKNLYHNVFRIQVQMVLIYTHSLSHFFASHAKILILFSSK